MFAIYVNVVLKFRVADEETCITMNVKSKSKQSIPYNAWAVHVYQHSELELDIFTRKHPWPTQLSIMPSADLHE